MSLFSSATFSASAAFSSACSFSRSALVYVCSVLPLLFSYLFLDTSLFLSLIISLIFLHLSSSITSYSCCAFIAFSSSLCLAYSFLRWSFAVRSSSLNSLILPSYSPCLFRAVRAFSYSFYTFKRDSDSSCSYFRILSLFFCSSSSAIIFCMLYDPSS